MFNITIINTYPSKFLDTKLKAGRGINSANSCANFIAAARTRRADRRPILKIKKQIKDGI